MSDTKESLERAWRLAPQPEDVMDNLIRRRARNQRKHRITAAVLAIIVSVVSFAALINTFRSVPRPAGEPTPHDIFARVHGWIAYGDSNMGPRLIVSCCSHIDQGIWAVNPARPGNPEAQVLLSDRAGEPLGWSSDGSKLLILGLLPDRNDALFVLNADGSEIRLTRPRDYVSTGSMSSDGSQVVYAAGPRSSLYVIDADGGRPRLLRSPGLYGPTFSPDGTQIAFFDVLGDSDLNLWVMNADGSDAHLLLRSAMTGTVFGRPRIAWSPDGSQLALEGTADESLATTGIWVVNSDGSGLKKVIPLGTNPFWSPDGSHIAYESIQYPFDSLEISDADGTHVQAFGYGGSGPWNPLPLSDSGGGETAASGESTPAAPLASALVLLALVGVVLLLHRIRRKSAIRT